jgi:hypothetical protein
VASMVRSGIPFRVSRDAQVASAHLTVALAASLEFAGTSGSPTSSPLPQCGSTVSSSAHRSRVVGLSRWPPMVLMFAHRTSGGHPGARMPDGMRPSCPSHLLQRRRVSSLLRTLPSPDPPETIGIRRHRPSEQIKLELLSWGFPKIPLHRDQDRASTPGWLPTLRLEVATLVLVPPLPFLPASTASSARPLQVCCTLHPIMRFGPFRDPSLVAPRGDTSALKPSPRPRFTPFRAFPSRTAAPRHRDPCPPAVRAAHE